MITMKIAPRIHSENENMFGLQNSCLFGIFFSNGIPLVWRTKKDIIDTSYSKYEYLSDDHIITRRFPMDVEVKRYRCKSLENASHTFTNGITDTLFKDPNWNKAYAM